MTGCNSKESRILSEGEGEALEHIADFAVRTPGMTDCSLALFNSYLRITFD